MSGFICVPCDAVTKVIDSRFGVRNTIEWVYRRRECPKCKTRFTTIEIDSDVLLNDLNVKATITHIKRYHKKVKKYAEGSLDRL